VPAKPVPLQGVAGNKMGEFEVEAQFLSKFEIITYTQWLHFHKLLLKGTQNEALSFLTLRFLIARDLL
jgi:hypothetical protein